MSEVMGDYLSGELSPSEMVGELSPLEMLGGVSRAGVAVGFFWLQAAG